MATKVKGLLRGLRYITQIFDEKEKEMQIGYPTDVKHVAHIGWDGPSANTPSWMNEFKTPSELANGSSSCTEELKNLSIQPLAEDTIQRERQKQRSRRSPVGVDSPLDSPARRSSASDVPKHSRRQTSSATSSPFNSPQSPDVPRHSRRHRSANNSMDSPRVESLGSVRTSKLHQNSIGAELPARSQPAIPKHSHGRKSKGSSGSGSSRSSRSSRSKEQNTSTDALSFSDPGPGDSGSVAGMKNTASHLSSVLEAYEEEG